MRAKHLYVLIHIRNKGEIGTIKHVYGLQYFYWLFQGGATSVDSVCSLCFIICLSYYIVCSL